MKKLNLIIASIILILNSNAQITSQTILGGSSDDRIGSVISLSTGGFLMAGYTASGVSSSRDVLLVKMNSFGDTIWTKTYATSSNEVATKCIETKKGNYLITGQIVDRILLLKTDTNGNILMQKAISHTRTTVSDYGYDLAETSTGDIYIGGKTNSGAGPTSGYIIKTDSSGTILWQKSIGRGNGYVFGISVNSKDEVTLVGQAQHSSYSIGGRNALVMKFGKRGQWLLGRVYGSNSDDNLFEVIALNDGSLVSVGYYGASGGRDALITKISSSGSLVWSKTYGGSSKETFMDVKQTSDGGFIAVGTTESFGKGGQDIYAVRTKSNGDTIWTRAYGGLKDDGGSGGAVDQWMGVCESAYGGFIITSYSANFSPDSNSVFVIQIDSNGHSSNCNEHLTKTTVLSPAILSTGVLAVYVINTSWGVTTNSTMVMLDSNRNKTSLTPSLQVFGSQAICSGDTAILSVRSSAAHQWSNGLGTNDSIKIAPSSSATYSVTATDSNSCKNTATVNVTVNPRPTIAISGKDSICVGDTAVLSASGAISYIWNNGVGSGSQVSLFPNMSTTYAITGTDTNGCIDSVSTTVIVNALPNIQASGTATICIGKTTGLMASGATKYSWDNGAGAGSSVNVTPIRTTTYKVIGTDSNSCFNSDHVTITVNPLPIIIASGSSTICDKDTAQLSVTGAQTYLWNQGIGTGDQVKVSPSTTTVYTVIGTDSNSCQNTDQVTITVTSLPSVLVNQIGEILTAQNVNAGVTYQWVNCNSNFSILPGDTNQIFTAGVNGNYAVVVIENECTDTSTCHQVKTIGILENGFENKPIVYPNPTSGHFSIQLKENTSTVKVTIIDYNGKVVQSKKYNENQLLNLKLEGTVGIYLLKIESENKKALIRLVKE